MRILQLCSSAGCFGVENVILELSKELSLSNVLPYVGVIRNLRKPSIELATKAQEYGLLIKIFDCHGQLDIRTIVNIRGFIKKNEISIVHSHGYKANFYALISTLHYDVALITTCHPWTGRNYSLRSRAYSWLDKRWLKYFDKTVAITDEIKIALLSSGVSESKVSVIDSGVDTIRFNQSYSKKHIKKQLGLSINDTIVGTVGRLVPEKGHNVFLYAVKEIIEQCPRCSFLIVGDGELRQTLEQQALNLGITEKVKFIGVRNDIPEMLAIIDIFVLPSISEGLPMVLLEAMAAKKPIIATPVGSIPKVIVHNENGLLVNPSNVQELIDAIIALIKNNKAMTLAENAYITVSEKFSSRLMAKRYMHIYKLAKTS